MVVWLGYDIPTPLSVAASDLAAPLWGWWMRRVASKEGDAPGPDFPTEPKLEKRWVCTITGKGPNATCKTIGAPFLPGTVPKGGCPILHPPPPPEVDELGNPIPPGHESLWKRLAREKAERDAAAAGGVPSGPGPLIPFPKPKPPGRTPP
jgi:hypothetical protein